MENTTHTTYVYEPSDSFTDFMPGNDETTKERGLLAVAEDLTEQKMHIAYFAIGTLGILGNLLVIVVLLHYKLLRRKITNMLIINQSLIDLTASFFLIATHVIEDMSWVASSSRIGAELFCR